MQQVPKGQKVNWLHCMIALICFFFFQFWFSNSTFDNFFNFNYVIQPNYLLKKLPFFVLNICILSCSFGSHVKCGVVLSFSFWNTWSAINFPGFHQLYATCLLKKGNGVVKRLADWFVIIVAFQVIILSSNKILGFIFKPLSL